MKGIVKVVTHYVVQGYNLIMITHSSKIGIVSLNQNHYVKLIFYVMVEIHMLFVKIFQ